MFEAAPIRDRAFAWLQKLVPAQVAVFGDAPFRNYTIFQRSDTLVNGEQNILKSTNPIPTPTVM